MSTNGRMGAAGCLSRRLEHFVRLSTEDKQALDAIAGVRLRTLEAHEDLIHEGDRPIYVNLFLDGWGCRYKTLEDGRRQIIAYFLPGDFCDLAAFILQEMDHSIGAITPMKVAEIPRDAIEALTLNHPRVTQALWWSTLVAAGIQREWTVNLGQRTGVERLGHLLVELFLRLRMLGLTDGDSCEMPLTQAELGDTLGLSTVHVNRTLQELRARELIILKGKRLTISDMSALQDASLFNPNYLHLGREGRHLDANS